MLRYLLRRLASLLPVLWVMATLVWVIMFLLPGDPARLLLGRTADPAAVAAVREELGLDAPLPVQYGRHLLRLLRLDLLVSYVQGRPVRQVVLEAAWPSLILATVAMLLALALGVGGALLAARRPGGAADRLVLLGSLGGLAVPVFWLGILLRMLFASGLGWLPPSSYTGGTVPAARLLGLPGLPMPDPAHLVLPALTLSGFSAALLARVVRASLLEAMSEDFIRTARAKGISTGAVLRRHALSHAVPPLATVAGLQLATVIGGAIATEILFAWPGLGSVLLRGILTRDMPVVSGCVLFLTLVFVALNLAADLICAWFDPRMRAAG